MTEPTTIQLKAVNPRPALAKPVEPERPTVHVRSAGALIGNVAAAVGEGVFAVGGGVGLAAAAAAAVGVPLAVQGARGRLQRQQAGTTQSHTRTTSTRGGSSGASGSGRRSAGSAGGASAGGRLRKALGGGGKGTGNSGAGRGTAGTARSGSIPGRRSTGAAGGGSATSPRAAARAARKAARAAGGAAPTTRLGRMLHNAQARHDGRWKRKGEKLAYQIAATARPAGRLRRGGSWARRNTARAGRWAWQRVRHGRVITPPATGVAPAPTPQKTGPKVSNTIRGGTNGQQTSTPRPAPAANPSPIDAATSSTDPTNPSGTPATTTGGTMTGGPAPSAMKAMLEVIETDLMRIATAYDPEGIEEVLAEYDKWPEVLDALGKVWAIMVKKAEEDYPLPPAAAAVVDEIRQHQTANARAAEAVPGLVRSIIRDRLDALADKRNAMYDHRVNPNTAAL